MSGVNSKCSRGDFNPPRPKRLKQDSPIDRVLNFPFELLDDIVCYFAADCVLDELLNLRLVSSTLNQEVYSALKANLALLPWIVQNGNSMDHVKTALSRAESGHLCVVKSLESYRRNVAPGRGLPIKLVANQWTPQLVSFLYDFSKEIVGFWICGEDFHGFPADLGGIELSALEHVSFTAICTRKNQKGFAKALAFWKKLVEVPKILKTCQVDIRIPLIFRHVQQLSPDDQAFDLVEWSRVNSLNCSYEFFVKASASNEFFGLQKLECVSASDAVPTEMATHLSLEKVTNLTEMKFGRQIEWTLNHQMQNLKVLMLEGTKMICGQSPSIFLPHLEKIALRDYDFSLTERSAFSCLLRGGGVYENVAELVLVERYMNVSLRDIASQLCDCFPKLTKLEWESHGVKSLAPVIFSKLDLLTRLNLRVQFDSREPRGRDVVELITGIPLEEIPVEKALWPTTLTGNPHSITNLKHLQSFGLHLPSGLINVSEKHANFLFTAAFRTMATLNDLSFDGIIFEDTSCAAEWQQLGRTIKMTRNNESSNRDEDSLESSSESDEVGDESSGDEWTASDSQSESSGDE